ncbi:hypothetical protein OGM63_19830 [Plectonema radiosum NIES-515]|uniref:Uncharacterized protein n=1 Tax=Plectonema radiosum NIES-515 TaxID=2986073 RepID=A0ABT3B2X8_9CYAN|nr:hypothetical protein [Plectonema radiosum]MCV3215731.1 hypothetical protein [Plectonema radiosum NIES-515]
MPQGEIVGLKVPEKTGIHPEAIEHFLKASPEALASANNRYQIFVFSTFIVSQKRLW